MRYCLGLTYDNWLDEKYVLQYYEYYKTIPAKWKQKIKQDGWQLHLTNNNKDFDSEGIKVDYNKKVIKLLASDNPKEQEKIVYSMFANYILYQYYSFSTSKEYKALKKKYSENIKKMHEQTENKYESLFSLLVFYYLNKDYELKFFEGNDILELYTYIDDWMTFKVFNIPYDLDWRSDFLIGKNIPYQAILDMDTVMFEIPEKLLEEMKNKYYSFMLINDEQSPKISNIKGRWSGLIILELAKVYIKPYGDIQKTLFHEVGHYFYQEYIEKDFKSKSIYEEEKNNLKDTLNDEYYKSEINEYYAETFAAYFLKPEYLKKYMRRTYTLIQAKMKRIISSK